MTLDPLYLFVFAGLFSPGPNVVMLTASGARFGFRRTVPHILGVALGVGITAGLTGLGVAAVLFAVPGLELVLRLAAVGWILWMAWQIYQAPRRQTDARDRPFSLIEAVLFQWVNPKVWAVAVAASAGYPSDLAPWGEALRLGSAFSGINLGVCIFWTAAGHFLRFLMETETAWHRFHTCMALLLAASAFAVLLT